MLTINKEKYKDNHWNKEMMEIIMLDIVIKM